MVASGPPACQLYMSKPWTFQDISSSRGSLCDLLGHTPMTCTDVEERPTTIPSTNDFVLTFILVFMFSHTIVLIVFSTRMTKEAKGETSSVVI